MVTVVDSANPKRVGIGIGSCGSVKAITSPEASFNVYLMLSAKAGATAEPIKRQKQNAGIILFRLGIRTSGDNFAGMNNVGSVFARDIKGYTGNTLNLSNVKPGITVSTGCSVPLRIEIPSWEEEGVTLREIEVVGLGRLPSSTCNKKSNPTLNPRLDPQNDRSFMVNHV